MLNRRSFMIATGMTALASTRVFGANDTLRIGVIGAGRRMRSLLDVADKAGPYQIVAVSDVYSPHSDAVKERSGGTRYGPPRLSGSPCSRTLMQCSLQPQITGMFVWRWMRWRRAKTFIWKSLSPTPSRKALRLRARSAPENKFCNAGCSSAVGRIFAMPSI